MLGEFFYMFLLNCMILDRIIWMWS